MPSYLQRVRTSGANGRGVVTVKVDVIDLKVQSEGRVHSDQPLTLHLVAIEIGVVRGAKLASRSCQLSSAVVVN